MFNRDELNEPAQDRLFDTLLATPSEFVFDAPVAAVFADMAQRSIPGYRTILETIGQLAKRFVQPNSLAYDLGCALGAASIAIYQNLPTNNCQIVAVDQSMAMVAACQRQVDDLQANHAIQVINADITQLTFERASMVVLNFTLQFIAPERRQTLLQRIYQGLKPGGILLLSEKLAAGGGAIHHLLDALHLDFKRAHGYSELAISQKRTALERSMHLDCLQTHQTRLRQAGFTKSNLWFQHFNFASLIAIKVGNR